MQKQKQISRYYNFPLILLAETIENPHEGLDQIINYCIQDHAQNRMGSVDEMSTLIQAMYVKSQRPSESLPPPVSRILAREDVAGAVEYVPQCFPVDGLGSGEIFIENMKECIADEAFLGNLQLSGREWSDLRQWYCRRSAMDFYGWISFALRVPFDTESHRREFGPLAFCSVPCDWLNEIWNKPDVRELRLFRCVAACRSIIGQKRFCGTTKDMIRARMIGGKSPKVAETIAAGSKSVRREFEILQRRRQFDNVITEADRECRGFITKMGAFKRIWLSTKAKSHNELAEMVNETRRRKANRRAEAEARKKLIR